MDLSEAINFLKKTVKESAIPGQRHLDLTLLSASEQVLGQQALATVHKAIFEQEISSEDFERQVGLRS